MNEKGPIYGVDLIDSLPLSYPDDGNGMRYAMPSRSTLLGVKDHKQGQRVVAGYEVLLNHWRAQTLEIERLQEIVDKLWKTADGVPLLPDMTVWTFSASRDNQVESAMVAGFSDGEVKVVFPDGVRWYYDPKDCYSTPEAAEAAREKP